MARRYFKIEISEYTENEADEPGSYQRYRSATIYEQVREEGDLDLDRIIRAVNGMEPRDGGS